jgi:hypothetical protein
LLISLMTPQKFILPQLLKIAKMVWDAAALWWEEWAVPWLRTSFREGMIPASSLSYLSKSIHLLSVQLNQFGWWFMKEWKALASVCKILKISLNCLSLFSGEATTKQIHWSSDWIYSSFSAKSSDKPTKIGMGSSLWLLQPLPNADAPSPSGIELTFLHTSNDWVHLSFFLFFESLALLLLSFYSRRKKRVSTAVVCLWCKEDGFWVFVLTGLTSFWKSVGSSSEWDSFVDKFWTTISLNIKVEE